MDEDGTPPEEVIGRLAALRDQDSTERWALVGALQQRADEPTMTAASAAAGSGDPVRAEVGVDVLAQFGAGVGGGVGPGSLFHAERLAAVLAAAERAGSEGSAGPVVLNESSGSSGSKGSSGSAGSDRLLASALIALGHLKDRRAQPVLLRNSGHADAWVRYAVTFALPLVTDAAVPDAGVVSALITLTRDVDDEVRNWAVFGLGRLLDADTPSIRSALAARLDDPDGSTAEEALLGLAKRHDEGAVDRLRAQLEGVPREMADDLAVAYPELESALPPE
jgi:HEAT repeat protein